MPKVATAVREGRRQQEIEAAWRCAARRKFAELTVDEICTEASLSKGAVYAYFDSKQMLLFALLNEEASSIDRLMAELKAADLTGVERLRRFARGMLERGESPGHAQVRADLWAEGLADEGVRDRLSVVIRERRARLRRWIEQGIRVVEHPTGLRDPRGGRVEGPVTKPARGPAAGWSAMARFSRSANVRTKGTLAP